MINIDATSTQGCTQGWYAAPRWGGWRNCPFKARHVQSPDAGRRSAHSGQPTLKNRIAPGENGTLQKLCDECARTDGGQHGHAVDLSWRAGKRAPAPLFIASSFLFSLSFGYVKTGSICVASAGDVAHSPSSFQMALCIFWTVTSGIKDLGCTFLLHLSWGGIVFICQAEAILKYYVVGIKGVTPDCRLSSGPGKVRHAV